MGVLEGTGPVWPKISSTIGHLPPTIVPARKLDERVFYMV